ncbi:hypothetical protein Sa4125_03910 [Aureimonas sp. SA4125]|nr:hypothetical protein Sa4125_03910 [Aureimonas sp. SA4125]
MIALNSAIYLTLHSFGSKIIYAALLIFSLVVALLTLRILRFWASSDFAVRRVGNGNPFAVGSWQTTGAASIEQQVHTIIQG